ncbi:MAG: M1 family metallopeptidase, partial [Gemmatimonadota bacterium]
MALRFTTVLTALALAACGDGAGTAYAQSDPSLSGGPITPEQASYDVTFYDLELNIDPTERSIDGALTVYVDVVQAMEYLVLDLDTTFTVHGAELLGGASPQALAVERRVGRLWLELPAVARPGERLGVRVAYRGQPRSVPPGGFDGFIWTETADGNPWISVSCELFGADIWWPVKDHPSDEPDSMALNFTVPEPLFVASNGRLDGITPHDDGTRTFHWFVSTPINNYGVSLNIANYVALEASYESASGESIPVWFWAIPEHETQARAALPEFLDHMRHLEEIAGPYPFRADKYGIAEVPYLGMEHQTVIAYGANFDNAAMTGVDYGYDALHQHELAHEWYGNQITPPNWADLWLNEGFATYSQALYVESRFGVEVARQMMTDMRARITNRQAVAPRAELNTREAYTLDIYMKGAWVLHSLRYLIGDEDFFEVLMQWNNPDEPVEGETGSCRCRFATTDDFVELVNEVTGDDLGWFFEVYVRQPELPRLSAMRDGANLTLRWDVPEDLHFPMPIDVRT